ncbi:MAG: hypothetical protein J2P37_31565, partial [Ktedonobacteraceae bacterium]|nr:hypothetical protein [Ktedonobacteraceae bacterium]
MKSIRRNHFFKRLLPGVLSLLVIGLLAACSSPDINATQSQNPLLNGNQPFTFPVVPAGTAIQKCLPSARGEVSIIPDKFNDTMNVQVYGLAPKQKYTLFVTQLP